MSKKLIKKNHSSSFKFAVVLSYLKGDKTMSDLSQEYGISCVTIGKWVKIFKENGKDLFENAGSKSSVSEASHERETSNLYKKIGELTVERDFLKKALDA